MREKPVIKKGKKSAGRKLSRQRIVLYAATVVAVATIALLVLSVIFNNIDPWTDKKFQQRLDSAIVEVERWVVEHKTDISTKKNAALLTMLAHCNRMHNNLQFSTIIDRFLKSPTSHYSRCWKAEVDPNHPIFQDDLNKAIAEESLDNKWALYALSPDMANITAEQLQLFEPDKWQHRKLTHQLWALTILKRTKGPDPKLDNLIEHLCSRLSSQLYFDLAVTDIYIQKVAFVLRAGHPEKIRRRWIERIIQNQNPDGGFNDRWLCFTSGRRPRFSKAPPSDQHATIQALHALYMAKYKYPYHFGLNPQDQPKSK